MDQNMELLFKIEENSRKQQKNTPLGRGLLFQWPTLLFAIIIFIIMQLFAKIKTQFDFFRQNEI